MGDAAKVVARNSNPKTSDVTNPRRQPKLALVVKARFPLQKTLCFSSHIGRRSCKGRGNSKLGRRSQPNNDNDSGEQNSNQNINASGK